MKITFLTPPPLDGKPAAERIFGCNYGIYTQQNIFILYPATVLKNAGYDVCVKDCPIERLKRSDFLQYIKNDDSDIYVFYTVFLSRNTDLLARSLIRELRPSSLFMFIGTEPTVNPGAFLDSNSFVIKGEPEETIGELLSALSQQKDLSTVKGVSYQINGKRYDTGSRSIIEDLDRLPFPDRSLLKAANYHNPKLSLTPFTTMISSRGCAYSCYYCVPNSLDFAREISYKSLNQEGKKPPVRIRSAENVINEIRHLHAEGFRSFSIIDDQFIWNRQRTIDICNGIKDLNLEWSCLARADHLDNEVMIRTMAEAGCRYIDMGIESFSQDILDYIHKDLKVESVYSAVALLKKYEIEPELNVLIGSCPLETKETIEFTISEVIKLDVDYVLFSICAPFPHTVFNALAKERKWMITDEYVPIDPIRQSLISYPHLSKDEMEKIIRKAYIRFYFRPSYIMKRMRRLKSAGDFLNKLKAAMSILRWS